ncbi:MAG: histone deacetylase family protein [Candidatus Micrarchaeia archaeon]
MQVFYSEKFLNHKTNTPDTPERLKAIVKKISNRSDFVFVEPTQTDEDMLLLVHEKPYLEKLKELCNIGADFGDNQFYGDTFEIAMLACSASCQAALNDGFALVRPPGHHAGKDFFGGFCFLNNIAVAVRARQRDIGGKSLIVDIDHHHGNGTQSIFYDDDTVFYISLHQDPRVSYPGTGFESENNETTLNIPLPPNTSDEEYLEKLRFALSIAEQNFSFDFVAVNAGFDTYYLDPVGGLGIRNVPTYEKIGEMIAELGKPTFAVLEGGYFEKMLGDMALSFLNGLQKRNQK